jgi:hypothetical protein
MPVQLNGFSGDGGALEAYADGCTLFSVLQDA